MNSGQSNIKDSELKILWSRISKRRQKQFWLIFFLMVAVSLLEVVSLGAVLPFLGALIAPEQIYHNSLMQPIVQILEITEPNQLILPMTTFFIAATIIAGMSRLILFYAMTRFSYAVGADLSIDIYRRTLYQDYKVHISRNSSEIINSVITKTSTVINGIFAPILTLLSSTILFISIIGILFIINIYIALSVFISFGLLYWLVIRHTKSYLEDNSLIIAKQSTQLVKALQEGMSGIRDVLIDGSQEFYCKLYSDADLPLRRASGDNQFISGSPRYIMEAIGMTLIAGFAYLLVQQDGGAVTAIPILGALALGAQKLLPALQQIYSSYSLIKGSKSSLKDVLYLLDQPLPSHDYKLSSKTISFKKEIKLINLSFRYSKESPWTLKDINLSLGKGERIGFIGETGSGKSTLLDIIMGLLSPTDGQLIIDQQPLNTQNYREWQAHIAHVPQSIFLSDDTIERNIAFGIPEEQINHQLVREVAQQAQIAELIKGWKYGYQTSVGERGVRLSGGQRQRIGIARALYKRADVLIFDEATSALDGQTERAVMEAIEGLGGNLTVLIIAHRLTTLKNCDKIIRLDKNNKLHTLSYDEIQHS